MILLRISFLILLGLAPGLALGDDAAWPPAMIKAQKSFEKGDYASVIKYCTETIAYDPESPEAASAYFDRAGAYNNTGHFSRAIADYSQSLKLQPDQWEAYYLRANSYESKGDYAGAIADYNQAITLGPLTQIGTVDAYNELAWLLATCPEAKFRDGKQAVGNATAAWEASMKRSHDAMDTLAAAYAATGDFASAVKWEQEYLATPDLDKTDRKGASKRLALYEAGKPYIDFDIRSR